VWPLFEDAVIIELIWSLLLTILDVKSEVATRRFERQRPRLRNIWYGKVNELITAGHNNLLRVLRHINVDVRAIGTFESRGAFANTVRLIALSVAVTIVHCFAFLRYRTAVGARQGIICNQIG